MNKVSLILSTAVIAAMMMTSCGSSGYKEVKIGDQVWMSENLNVDKFRNGDPIPHAKTNEEWKTAGENEQPAWCYYDNDPANDAKYGKLYNWYAVNDWRGLAPEGWHIPSDAEWTELTDCLGGERVAGGKLKETGTTHWNSPNTGATNETGFTALPAGYSTGGSSYGMGTNAYFWAVTEGVASDAWGRILCSGNAQLLRHNHTGTAGFSVRCLQN